MRFRTCMLLACFAALGCGRTGLDGAELGGSELGDPELPGPPLDAGTGGRSSAKPPEPPEDKPVLHVGPLPEVTVAAVVENEQGRALSLVAPLAALRGPFDVAQDTWFATFSPGGERFAYLTEEELFLVTDWPPAPRALETGSSPRDFIWYGERHLFVTTDLSIELLDLDSGTRETLYVTEPTGAPLGYPTLYIARPSPDARWLAFAKYDAGIHQVWLLDLEAPERAPVLVHALEPGAVVAWFDWAPDSAHLALAVTDTNGLWLRAHSIATRGGLGEVLPLSIPLDETSAVLTFEWSPSGDALHYYYEHVDLPTSQAEFRLYFVDMSEQAPGESVLLSTFAERSWASQGTWSPSGDHVAFSADFAGTTFRAAQFVSSTSAPTTPVKQHAGEFESVLKQAWSPTGEALYFTAMNADQVERLYKSDLSGDAVQMSPSAADARGLYVSPEPGCIAYSQFRPTPALTIVNERTATYSEVGQPESNNPDWSGSFNSSSAEWVSDSSGLRGLLYVTNSPEIGETLAWVAVNDCVPDQPEVLIEGQTSQDIYNVRVSTAPPPERSF